MRPASRKAAAGGETAAGSSAELIDATGTVANCARAGGERSGGNRAGGARGDQFLERDRGVRGPVGGDGPALTEQLADDHVVPRCVHRVDGEQPVLGVVEDG